MGDLDLLLPPLYMLPLLLLLDRLLLLIDFLCTGLLLLDLVLLIPSVGGR